MRRTIILSALVPLSFGFEVAQIQDVYFDERFKKSLPDLPIKQTYIPKVNRKSKRW